MPFYNYYCEPCEDIFEELVSPSDFHTLQECPDCSSLCNRTAEGQMINAHGIGLKEHVSRSSRAKVEEKWMSDEIDNTKNILEGEGGPSPYASYKINPEVAVKQGLAKKVDPKTAKIRRESSAQLTRNAAKAMSEKDLKRAQNGHNNKNQ